MAIEYLPISPRRSTRPDYYTPLPAPGSGRINVVYIRKSRVTSERVVSDEMQLAEAQRLAVQHGVPAAQLTVMSDMNRSGAGAKTLRRTEYLRLKAIIEANGVDYLFAYSLTRLGRNTVEIMKLLELCMEHGTTIRLATDSWINNLDPHSPYGKFTVGLFAMIGQLQLEMMTETVRDAMRTLQDDGIVLGQLDYGKRRTADRKGIEHNPDEPVHRVVELFREHRTYMGTAKALTLEGIPTRRGHPWSAISVRNIVAREAPELMPVHAKRGVKPAAPFRFYRLLRCHCGHILTGSRHLYRSHPGADPYVRYVCSRAGTDPHHGGARSVTERVILEWAKAEAARLVVPGDLVEAAQDHATERAALDGRRKRVLDNYEDDEIDKQERDRKLAAIKARLDELEAASRATKVPAAVDWSWDAVHVNDVLRAMWEHVELDDQLRPVQAKWVVPELRRPDQPR